MSHFFGGVVITTLLTLSGVSSGCAGPSQFNPSAPSAAPAPSTPSITISTPPPRIVAISPTIGFMGDTVKVTGTGFMSNVNLMLGEVSARVISIDSELITAIVPTHRGGIVDVSITNTDGQRTTVPAGFTYDGVSITATPNSIEAGTELLTVSWVIPRVPPSWASIVLIKNVELRGHAPTLWEYSGLPASGTTTLKAPSAPGVYEFRYGWTDMDGFFVLERSGPVTVR